MAAIGERIGPFELVGRLSEGGGLEHWEARRDDGTLKEPQHVDVRLVADVDDLDAAHSLRGEYEALRRVDDPRIPTVVGFFAGQGALVLQHIEGVTLEQILEAARRGFVPLSPSTALDLVLEIAHALRAAHSILLDGGGRIAHGWLDPTRVLIDAEGDLYVLGLGGPWDQADPRYLPPERRGGGIAELAGDQWMVGAILYELLAGMPLQDLGTDGTPLLLESVEGPLGDLDVRFPSAARLLRKVLAYDPRDRYRVDRELLRALHGLHREHGGPSARHELHARVHARLSELVDPVDVPTGFHRVGEGERQVSRDVREQLRRELDTAEPPVLLGNPKALPLLDEDSRDIDTETDVLPELPPISPALPEERRHPIFGEWTVLLVCLLFLMALLFFMSQKVL
ncbi:MAG TPA: hypothetical protein QGF58_27240 [Myxococcota bacterium]|nr:hypothetical protein [Myxococcota bacterium]